MSLLTRKQQWRRAGYGNRYLRNMNMDNYFGCDRNQCEMPIRAYSDTALATKTEDNVSRPPMRSSITMGNIDSLKNDQSMKGCLKKKVRFDNCARVILITSRAEYIQAGLYSTLWYKHDDYIEFKKETLKELASISIDILKNVNNDAVHEQSDQLEQRKRQALVHDNTEENKNGGNINTDNLSDSHSSSSIAGWEKRTSLSYTSGLDRLVEMYKNTSCSDGNSATGHNDDMVEKNDDGNNYGASRTSPGSEVLPLENEIINSIVEKGEEKARKQAILSRRLAEEQLNNQQYIAKNPMTLMCT